MFSRSPHELVGFKKVREQKIGRTVAWWGRWWATRPLQQRVVVVRHTVVENSTNDWRSCPSCPPRETVPQWRGKRWPHRHRAGMASEAVAPSLEAVPV